MSRPVPAVLPEVRPHRTRGGRLDYVTVQREADGVVRVLGWYGSRTAAQHAIASPEDRSAPLVLRVVAAVVRPLTALVR